MRRIHWNEITAVTAVLLVLIGLPIVLYAWQTRIVPRQYPPNTKIINLTAVAKDGIWTEENVVGINYWWHAPKRTSEIALNQGDHVVLRLQSVDVLHTFAVPALRLGPVEVPAGHLVEVSFTPSRPGNLTFLCWQVCSANHSRLYGHFKVTGTATDERW